MKYELLAVYDSRQSFYHEAIVECDNGVETLYSYNTKVAYIDKSGAHVIGTYSLTTLRHIREFLRQHNYKVGSGKEIMEMYGVNEVLQ